MNTKRIRIVKLVSAVAMTFATIFIFSFRNAVDDTVVFQYQPQSGAHPYDQSFVSDESKWAPAPDQCTSGMSEDAACSIVVLKSNTVGGAGLVLDNTKVSISTGGSSTQATVVNGTGYTNPINIELP
ncbi:hypothetical protein [Niabella aurantiaca]|uniref:hypothetical protein n=1 Tax=Niabella aurantiaca TaxID=379900 RepID=UPI000361F812|nr:hypothetical protein [Niabella aurantiaca]